MPSDSDSCGFCHISARTQLIIVASVTLPACVVLGIVMPLKNVHPIFIVGTVFNWIGVFLWSFGLYATVKERPKCLLGFAYALVTGLVAQWLSTIIAFLLGKSENQDIFVVLGGLIFLVIFVAGVVFCAVVSRDDVKRKRKRMKSKKVASRKEIADIPVKVVVEAPVPAENAEKSSEPEESSSEPAKESEGDL